MMYRGYNTSVFRHEAPLLFAIFLDLVGFGMVIPDVQTRLERFGADGARIGLVLSSYFLVQILVSPRWGRWSDRAGRKPVLVICGTLSALSLLLYAFADTPWLILGSRVLAGFAAANTAAAQAYIADAAPDADARTAAMGRVGAAITAGLMLGPVLGGGLAAMGGNRLLGLAASAASGLGALWLFLALPRVPPVAPGKTPLEARSDAKSGGAGRALLRDVPALRPLLALATLSLLALACLEGTFGRLIHRTLGFGPPQFGLIFSFEALLGVVVQSLLLGWLTRRRVGPRVLLGGGFALEGIGLGLTPFAPNLAALFGASALYGIGQGVANPTLNARCSAATPTDRQGEMFGLLQSARSVGFLLGPTLGGILFDWRPAAPYLGAALVLALAAAAAQPALKQP